MAVVSTVRLSDLARHNRIDADRYHTDFLKLESRLRTIPAVRKLSLLITEPVRTGHTPAIREIRENDERVYFVKTDTLREGVIDFDNSDYLPSRVLSNRDYLRHQEVIVTIVGAHYDIVGRAAVYVEHYPKCVVNQNIAIIRPDVRQLNPFYLEVFLNCRHGRQYLWMLSRQTEQVNLNCREVEELLVPLFDSTLQGHIASLAKQSIQFIETSKTLYSQAENLLLEELRLKDFRPKYELSYTASLSNAFGVHRVDAEYFQPVYETLLKRIKKFEFNELGRIAERVAIKLKPNPEEVYKYIEVSDIDVGIGETNYTERLGKELPPNARIPINGGELIISKVRPTRGAISIIPKELNASVICSSAFSVFKVESPLKEYMYMVSRSLVGRLQMERPTTGTSYPTIDDKDIENIEIPLLPSETQQKIASLVQQSHEGRRKAKELLEEATKKVENLIEGEAA